VDEDETNLDLDIGGNPPEVREVWDSRPGDEFITLVDCYYGSPLKGSVIKVLTPRDLAGSVSIETSTGQIYHGWNIWKHDFSPVTKEIDPKTLSSEEIAQAKSLPSAEDALNFVRRKP